MESTNLHEEEYHQNQHQQLDQDHHHHHHHQLVLQSSDHHHHAWRPSPNFLLNNNNIHANCGEEGSNSLTNSMIQNMGFGWANPSNLNHDGIKQESSSNSSSSDHHHHHPHSSTSPMLLINTLSPNMLHHQGANKGVTSTNFSQIFPTVNISNISNINEEEDDHHHNNNNNLSELISTSSLDVFETARLLNGGSDFDCQEVAPSNTHLLELFKFENHHHLQEQSSDLKLWNRANNLSSFDNNGEFPDPKRHNSFTVEPKSTQHHQMVSKKPRFDSRSSCPPFKVRKEKLGDRIAALQQLVAPFGKTDTASVLMEAIGYIKFLQNQVETLSVPYMRNKRSTNNNQRVSEEGEEYKAELRSRGLCLVPLSCMSYLETDVCSATGPVWPSPNFHTGF